MADLVSGSGIRAVKFRRGLNWQPLHGGYVVISVWQTIDNADGSDPASIVILRNVLTKRHHQIRAIKSTVTLDIGERCLPIIHLREDILLQCCGINLKRFHGHGIDAQSDLTVGHCLIGDFCHQVHDRFRSFHAGLVVEEQVQCRRA